MYYDKILVPLDGSDPSIVAAKHATQIAIKFNAEVTFLYVCPVFNFMSEFSIHAATDYTQIKEEFTVQGNKILDYSLQEIHLEGIITKRKLCWGYPAEEIIKEAKAGEYDLIVTGSRGLSTVKGYLMGSVSNRITKHAPCPVLVVR